MSEVPLQEGRREPSTGASFPQILYEKKIRLYISGDEIYFTNSLILLVKNMLYSKLHCQRGFNLILFSCKIWGAAFAALLLLRGFEVTDVQCGVWDVGFGVECLGIRA